VENYKDLLGEAKALIEKAKTIMADPEAPPDHKANVTQMMQDAKDLQARAAQLKELESMHAKVTAEADEAAAVDEAKQKRKDPREFKDWAEFLQAAHTASMVRDKKSVDPRLQWFKDEMKGGHEPEEGKQMVESVGASGGFLVPTEFLASMQAVMGEQSIVRSRATTIRMRRRAIQLPVLDQTGTTSGVPHWFGGMQFYWEEEAAAKTKTEAEFRQVELVAHKLIGYTRASDELLDDSAISLSDFLSGPMGMAGGVAWMEDYAFLRGTGAGQPLGIINAGATIVEPRLAAGTIGFDDVADMMEDFLPTGRGVWIVTQSAMSEIIQMSGPAGNASYIWQPNARDGIPGSMLGFPVIWTEKLPLLGTQGDILLADLSYYLIGDRQATTIESTQFDYWRYDQTSWRAVHRVDGQPWLSAPLTYQDGTTQVSPFVILGAAAGS
jgi:HK97 family phage major capsid protein